MSKKVMAMLLALVMIISMVPAVSFVASAANNSRQLMVSGNQLVYADSPATAVRLTGVNLAGGEWTGTPDAERINRSAIEAINNWNCNLLRLPVSVEGWYGNYSYVYDGGTRYREYMDNVIDIASQAGVYVVLDLHHYKCFDNSLYIDFWKDAAVRYANNPTVLYGILNEPHSVGWDVWRNGDGSSITGHQQVVEMIRDLGARNIIVAGGLDWGYSLTGIADGYALVDQGTNNNAANAGYGIMYDSHIYPWKGRTSNWDGQVGGARKIAPILVGECGWDADTNLAVGGKTYQPGDVMYHDKWVPELLNWLDDTTKYGAAANYTAYSLHPSSSPRLVGDKDNWKNDATYKYPPTDFWGVYVKDHLAKCAIERKNAPITSIRVSNPKTIYYQYNELDLTEGSVVINYSDGSAITISLSADGVQVTGFESNTVGTKTLTVSYMGHTTTYDVTINGTTDWAARATFDAGSYINFASNAFDIKWNGQTGEDTFVRGSGDGLGINGSNALAFDYNRTGGWGGVQTATIPSTWNWSKTQYISFYAKIIPAADNTSNAFKMSIGGTSGGCYFDATTDWKYFSFDMSGIDLTTANQLQWTVNNKGAGKLLMDNLTISNYEIAEGEEPVPAPDGVVPTSIAVSNAKTSYVVGDAFVAPTVTATFSDGSTRNVTASFSGYDMNYAGSYKITVLYEDTRAYYTIEVESTSYARTATFDADADIVFANNAFDIRWAGQTSADTVVKTSADGEGLDGSNALGFNYARTGGWGGVQTATVPSNWNWERTKYISFYARIIPAADNTSNAFKISISGTSGSCSFTATTDWQFYCFNLSGVDLTTATQLQWTQNDRGAGKLIMDNLTISNYELSEGENPTPSPEPVPVVLSSIAISNAKTVYTEGDAFVAPTVTASYSDGSTKNVNATFSGYDMNTPGTYTVTAEYEGKTATYTITVEALPWVASATFDDDADIVFANNAFDIRWAGQTAEDTFVKGSADGLGLDGGNALAFDYVRTGWWGGTQTATVPSSWDWTKTKYISFYARIIPTADNTSNTFAMSIGNTSSSCNFEATRGWQFYSFDLTGTDLSSASQLQWTVNNGGTGKLVIDNLTISNYPIYSTKALLQSISVTGGKMEFGKGNEFEGATVTANYSDGSTKIVSPEYTGYDMSVVGTQTVEAKYQGFVTTYEITVTEASWSMAATFDDDADIVFANNAFDIRWAGQTAQDVVTISSGNGLGLYSSNALAVDYARTGWWGGTQTATVPSNWDWTKTKYISFYARIIPAADNESNTFGLNIGGTGISCTFDATTQWQYYSFNIADADLTTAAELQLTQHNNGAGKLIIDNLTISNYEIAPIEIPDVEPEPDPVVLSSIAIGNAKTVYTEGDAFVAPTVTASYSDGSSKTVNANFSGYNMNVAGTYTVTAEYEGKTATYTITVEAVEIIVPDEPQTVAATYLDLDFEDAAYQVVDGTENKSVIETTNKATGEKFAVNLYSNDNYRFYNIYTDSTTYIAPNGRKQNCAYDIRLEEAVADVTNKVYIDMRINRVSYALDDPISVAFTDDNGNAIFLIRYTQGNVPTLIADRTYGTETSDTSATDVTYPVAPGWRCVRAIVDFNTSTFELYQGEDFDNMSAFVKGTNTFSFASDAANFSRITNYNIGDRKGSLGFDDIKVYTVGEEASERTVYVQQNFDDAYLAAYDYVTDAATGAYSVPRNTSVAVNAINSASGEILPWYTYNVSRDVSDSGFFYAPYEVGTNDDGSANYALMPADRKRQASAYVTMDAYDAYGNAMPAPVYDEGKKTVVTMRVKRVNPTNDDPVTIAFSDSDGKSIFSLVYKQNLYPQLVAAATYGGEGSSDATVTNYPFGSDWVYVQAEMDFDSKTLKMYVGETPDTMVPFVSNVESYDFADVSAQNFYKILISYKGSLGIDDFTVYTE